MGSELAAFEAFTKSADVTGGVAEGEPDDFGISVSQRAFCGFPNDVWNFGGFVEYQEQAFAFVVEACERGWVFLRPRDHINAPSALAIGVFGEEAGCG